MGTIAAAAIAAGAAYYSSKQQKDAAEKAAKAQNAAYQAGTSNNPWGPSVDYRIAGMQRADTLWKQRNDPEFWGYTGGAGSPNAITQTSSPNGGRGGRGGNGGGGGAGGAGFNGVSGNTSRILGDLTSRAEAGHPLYGASTAFTQKLLNGEETDPYRAAAWDTVSNLSDPDLQRFKDMLFAGQTPGSWSGGGYGSGGYGGGGGGGGFSPNPNDMVGAKAALQGRIAGNDLDQENPHMQAMVDAATRQIKRQFSDVKIPGINDEFTGAGRFGGGLYSDALGKAAGEYATSLGDVTSKLYYDDYEARKADQSAALQLGTQYDMNVMDNATQAGAASASAGASRYATDSQAALARMGALQDAIGMGIDLSKFGASGQMTLSQMYGQDQMGALGLVPELTGLDIRDLTAAGQLSLGADSNQNARLSADRSINAQRSAANAALNWQKEVYNREAPWNDQMRYADLINAYSGGYGSNQGNGAPYTPAYTSNPWVQAVVGGIAGYSMAGGFQSPTASSYGSYYQQPPFSYGYTGGPGGGAGGSMGTYGYGWNLDQFGGGR